MPRKPTRTMVPSYTLTDVADSFRRALEARNLSRDTIASYTVALRLFTRYAQDNDISLLGDVTAAHTQAWLVTILQQQSAHTAGSRAGGLRQFWKWCVAEDLIATSPMVTVAQPHLPEHLRRVLTDEEIHALLKTCASKSFVDVRDQAIIRVFLDTGLRLTELASIRLEDISWNERIIRVPVGKGGKWRIVGYGAKTATYLDRYQRARTAYAAQHGYGDLPGLWLGTRGVLHRTAMQDMLHTRSLRAGCVPIHAHLFRHTFIDRLKRSDMKEEDIMALTGHASTEVFQHYAKTLRSERALSAYRGNAPGDKI